MTLRCNQLRWAGCHGHSRSSRQATSSTYTNPHAHVHTLAASRAATFSSTVRTPLTDDTNSRKKKGSTDVPFFASPLEFVLHAEWLMRGAHRTPDKSRAPRCACKYCDVDVRGRKQSEISRELRARRARVLVLLAEDGDGDGNADDADDADELANDT